jgi:competence protein ComEC
VAHAVWLRPSLVLVVELAMTLPMAIYFHRIALFALPVNLFILPLLAVLMPTALLTLATLIVWPAAAVVPAILAGAFLHLGVGLVHLFGSVAMGDFRIPAPLAWQSLAFCALLASAVALARASSLHSWQRWVQCCPGRSITHTMLCWLRRSTWDRATQSY